MSIPNEMIANQVEHRHAGNGWAVVGSHDDGFLDIVFTGKGQVGSQIFHAWDKCLSLGKLCENKGTVKRPNWVTTDKNIPIHHTILEKIGDIRTKLESGQYVVKNTRLVKV